jgi:ubiquinone/menaquinone biosynthesis C-methylase UbiE
MFLRDRVVRYLWIIYGYTYDGLLHFYPYRRLLQTVAKIVENQTQKGPILELGSGTGNLIVAIRSLVPEIMIAGVDMSPTMTTIARKKLSSEPNVKVVLDDAVAYLHELPANSVEVIVMQNSLYAIADRDELWTELRRVVMDQGSVVVSNSDKTGSGSIIKEHLRSEYFRKVTAPQAIACRVDRHVYKSIFSDWYI